MGCGFKPHQTTKTTCGFMWLEGHDPFKAHTPHLPMGMWLCGCEWLWLASSWAQKR